MVPAGTTVSTASRSGPAASTRARPSSAATRTAGSPLCDCGDDPRHAERQQVQEHSRKIRAVTNGPAPYS